MPNSVAIAPDAVLALSGVSKRFGPVMALQNIDFDLQAGEVRALLGINGAGKSTLVKILSGLYHKDGGEIRIAGARVELGSTSAARQAGIASVQQHPELVESLTGYENIYLGTEGSGGILGRLDRKALRQRALELVARFGLAVDLDRPLGQMSAVEKEAVAILQALALDEIKVLILDEPTSVLTEREKDQLFGIVAAVKARGIAVIYITHRLYEVFEVADSFTIFRGGRVITTRSVADSGLRVLEIAELMLGTDLAAVYPDRAQVAGNEVVLATQGLTLPGAFADVALEARRGEILGIFGLLGSGLDEFSKTLFGVFRPMSGTIQLNGKPVGFTSPEGAIRAGIFLVPGDRKTEGLTLERDVAFNTTLARLSRVTRAAFLRFRQARQDSAALADKVELSPRNTYLPLSAFSGGNQQKVVVAKGLFAEADVYIFVEPTVGVDIGARAKIYALIRELSRRAAVIVMSSDAEEAYGLADRVMAFHQGRVSLQAAAIDTTREVLLAAGLSGAAQ